MPKPSKPARNLSDPLLAAIATQLRGVMGPLQERADVVLTGDYERDRAACEDAIRKAQAELEAVGEEADPKQADLSLAWAWHVLHEAYLRLANLESRTRLARRRAQLKQSRDAQTRRE